MFDNLNLAQYIEFNLLFWLCFGMAGLFLLGGVVFLITYSPGFGRLLLCISSAAATLGSKLQKGATGLWGWDVVMYVCMAATVLTLVLLLLHLRLRFRAARAWREMGW